MVRFLKIVSVITVVVVGTLLIASTVLYSSAEETAHPNLKHHERHILPHVRGAKRLWSTQIESEQDTPEQVQVEAPSSAALPSAQNADSSEDVKARIPASQSDVKAAAAADDPETRIISNEWKLRPYDGAYGAHPRVQAADCASYFGNGYATDLPFIPSPKELGQFDVLHQSISSKKTAGSWVMCHHNGPVTTTVCDFGMVRINPEQIALSRGGEPMQAVLGRSEDAEFPRYRAGALQVFSESAVQMPFSIDPAQVHNLNYDFLKAIERSPSPLECQATIRTPTIVITRYEYANLFHQTTDWYNVFMVARMYNLNRPNVLFVDGHAKGILDGVWSTFSEPIFVKHLKGPVCFKELYLAPVGYQAPISTGITPMQQCTPHQQTMVRQFGHWILESHGLTPAPPVQASEVSSNLRILFIRREDYKAHPRQTGSIVRRLGNEAAINAALTEWAATRTRQGLKTSLIDGHFSQVSFDEQLERVQSATVILGAHGAGLSHVLFSREGTYVMEIATPEFTRPHFEAYCIWAGCKYFKLKVHSTNPSPSLLLERLEGLLSS